MVGRPRTLGKTDRDLMLDYIDLVCDRGGKAPSQSELVNYSGCSERVVREFLRSALAAGWLIRDRNNGPIEVAGLKLTIRQLPDYLQTDFRNG